MNYPFIQSRWYSYICLVSIALTPIFIACDSTVVGEINPSFAEHELVDHGNGNVLLEYERSGIRVLEWAVFFFQAGGGTDIIDELWVEEGIADVSDYFFAASLRSLYLRGHETPQQGADLVVSNNGAPISIGSDCNVHEAEELASERLAEIYGQPTSITSKYDKYTFIMTGCEDSNFFATINQPFSALTFAANQGEPWGGFQWFMKAFLHEIGHSLGYRHAGKVRDAAGQFCHFGSDGLYSPNCMIGSTTDPHSVMSWGTCENQPSLPEKVQMGWTDAVIEHTSGTASYDLEPLEDVPRLLHGVRMFYGNDVNNDGHPIDILISHRRETKRYQNGSGCVNHSNAIEIHLTNVPDDLNGTPNFAQIATLRPGDSYNFVPTPDSDLHATIVVGEVGSNGLIEVTVTMNN